MKTLTELEEEGKCISEQSAIDAMMSEQDSIEPITIPWKVTEAWLIEMPAMEPPKKEEKKALQRIRHRSESASEYEKIMRAEVDRSETRGFFLKDKTGELFLYMSLVWWNIFNQHVRTVIRVKKV